jgi:hypothetical protein
MRRTYNLAVSARDFLRIGMASVRPNERKLMFRVARQLE